MHNAWKNFIDSIDMPVEYLHRDEYELRKKTSELSFPVMDYPGVLLQRENQVSIIVSKDELIRLKSINELKEIILRKVSEQ